MPTLTLTDVTHSINVYYEDHGSGAPVVLIHGAGPFRTHGEACGPMT